LGFETVEVQVAVCCDRDPGAGEDLPNCVSILSCCETSFSLAAASWLVTGSNKKCLWRTLHGLSDCVGRRSLEYTCNFGADLGGSGDVLTSSIDHIKKHDLPTGCLIYRDALF